MCSAVMGDFHEPQGAAFLPFIWHPPESLNSTRCWSHLSNGVDYSLSQHLDDCWDKVTLSRIRQPWVHRGRYQELDRDIWVPLHPQALLICIDEVLTIDV